MRLMRNVIAAAAIFVVASPASSANSAAMFGPRAEQLLRPYVDTNNFSGVVLAARGGKPVFYRAYGFADFGKHIPNGMRTRFHIASMSMQFTAAAALRLVMARRLSLDTPVARYAPELPNARQITVRQLLTQTSGIRDINGLPDYEAVLKEHQTPQSLVAKVTSLPPERAPGSYEHEEHSAFNLLALIVERETRLPFARAIKQLVFEPLGMKDSGIDDDGAAARTLAASGHAPLGVRGLVPAAAIHWSAKAGNGSAYTTAADQLRFVQGMTDSTFLSPELRSTVFDLSQRVGYGWFKANSQRFGEPVYSMNGRAPGFASAMIYVPRERLFVVALSNIYASFAPDIVNELAALMLGRPYEQLKLETRTDVASLNGLPAKFRFGADFYQPNAVVDVASANGELFLEWPTGDRSPLIPAATDHFIDRAYGVPVEIVRGADGRPMSLKYDKFLGQLVSES